ncbi:MAG TPA: iron-sulfur cluster repair di-iron protein [Terriglobales bacterium]|jgi:regulator of cell morphogenesis and NO signaling
MQTEMIDAERTVGELAVGAPGAARVFERAGIDFCCGGKKPLREACREQGVDLEEILASLRASEEERAPAPDAHWQREPLPALIAHIVERHHQYVRRETPHIETWLEKCIAAHGSRHPELMRIRHTFMAMAGEMAQHMAKEELILFPAISRMAAGRTDPSGGVASLTQPVRMMLVEHDHAGRDLAEIRKLGGDFMPPPDACNTYRTLYQALGQFEADMKQHVHLENNILFPRALATEAEAGHGQPD